MSEREIIMLKQIALPIWCFFWCTHHVTRWYRGYSATSIGVEATQLMSTGNLARIEGEEVVALGKEPFDVLANIKEGATLDEKIEVVLKQVYDPEIPVNIVDLGLVYTVNTRELGDSHQFAVDVGMTLTAPGCVDGSCHCRRRQALVVTG